jgi:hypothetical protein
MVWWMPGPPPKCVHPALPHHNAGMTYISTYTSYILMGRDLYPHPLSWTGQVDPTVDTDEVYYQKELFKI